MMKERDRVKRLTETRPEMWPSYRKLRYQVTNKIRLDIQSYYSGVIKEKEGDPKRMWKAINKVNKGIPILVSLLALNWMEKA